VHAVWLGVVVEKEEMFTFPLFFIAYNLIYPSYHLCYIPFMRLIEEELAAVNEQLGNIYIENENINTSLNAFLSSGSKRIRTRLVSLYLKSLGCDISQNSIKIMAAGELIHNASLLHDDVIDDANLRRGKSTLQASFSPYISILTGDYILACATEKLMEVNNQKILQIFLNCTKQMCNSEINQFFLRGKLPELKDYIKICGGKTAYLFQAVMESCLIIQGLENPDALSFAHDFGILFQLKNDLEKNSANADKTNNIFTPKDFLGIEKTNDLIDNYQRSVRSFVSKLPDNIYKKGLESLLSEL